MDEVFESEALEEETEAIEEEGHADGYNAAILDELIELNESIDAFVEFYEGGRDLQDERDIEYHADVSELLRTIAENGENEPIELSGDAMDTLDTIAINTEAGNAYQRDELSYYADLSLILLVMIVLPIYIGYRVLKSVFGLTRFL